MLPLSTHCFQSISGSSSPRWRCDSGELLADVPGLQDDARIVRLLEPHPMPKLDRAWPARCHARTAEQTLHTRFAGAAQP